MVTIKMIRFCFQVWRQWCCLCNCFHSGENVS